MSESAVKRRLPTTVPKKATNISLPLDLYVAAKELHINISQLCEQVLREEVRALNERKWNADNAAFLTQYNKIIEDEGVALDEWRAF